MPACSSSDFPVSPLFSRCARTVGRVLSRRAAPLLALAAALALGLATALSGAEAAPPGELSQQDASARAAHLYNFLGYIEWPSRAFALADSPLVIGVVNAEPVAAELLLSTVGRNVNDRPVYKRSVLPIHSGQCGEQCETMTLLARLDPADGWRAPHLWLEVSK